MKRFKLFVLDEATLTASGAKAEYHTNKYIKPFIGQKDTHTLKTEHEGLDKNKPITIHGHEEINGKHHAIVSQGGGRSIKVPYSKINKPSDGKENKGLAFEDHFISHLKKHRLMPEEASGAGSTGGTDFVLHNRKTNKMHKGKAEENILRGETKLDRTAAFGQLTIHHSPELGWHVKDKNRNNRPNFAKHVDEHVIKHLNKHYPNGLKDIPETQSGLKKNIVVHTDDLKPAEAYAKDHHVDVLHVSSHGTYHVGDKDKTGIGLPRFEGKNGKFTVRQKNRFSKQGALTVQFQPGSVNSLEKSHIHLEDEKHLPKVKKALGVE